MMNDKIKWVLVFALVALGGAGQYFYSAMPMSQLLLGWLVIGVISLVISSTTEAGQSFIGFTKDANIELRKVVWPTRQEAIQTTLIVLAVVMIMGIILWLMDAVLLHVVGVITGQKG